MSPENEKPTTVTVGEFTSADNPVNWAWSAGQCKVFHGMRSVEYTIEDCMKIFGISEPIQFPKNDVLSIQWLPATPQAVGGGDKGEGEMNYYYFYFKSVNSSEVIRTPSDKTATALFMSGRYVECTKEEYEIAVESNSTSDAQPPPAATSAPDGEGG